MKNKCIMKNVEIFRCTCALVGLACTSAFAQVKHASFSEIINPVVVDGGTVFLWRMKLLLPGEIITTMVFWM